jgi:hypothetical protein
VRFEDREKRPGVNAQRARVYEVWVPGGQRAPRRSLQSMMLFTSAHTGFMSEKARHILAILL